VQTCSVDPDAAKDLGGWATVAVGSQLGLSAIVLPRERSSCNRPAAASSSVARSWASTAGWRRQTLSTKVPTRSRSLAAATTASGGIAAYCPMRWSGSTNVEQPTASALRAREVSSALTCSRKGTWDLVSRRGSPIRQRPNRRIVRRSVAHPGLSVTPQKAHMCAATSADCLAAVGRSQPAGFGIKATARTLKTSGNTVR